MITFELYSQSMITLDEIRKPVANYMDEFELRFSSSLQSDVPLLNIITRYILKRKGKMMRPLFVFLSAGICGGVSDSTYRAASFIEMMHTATLVHDDVVDDSDLRRGFFSIKAIWKNKIAVLVGDYLLSRGLLNALEDKEFELLRLISSAVKEMSEGELLQIEKARKLNVEEDVYYDIINKKTASLIAACCATGAASTGAGNDAVERMKLFGKMTGMAFQIKDDLLDFESSAIIGKPVAIDIKEKKLTLPLIYMLNHSGTFDRIKFKHIIKNYGKNKKMIDSVIKEVKTSGGLEYARSKMDDYKAKAFEVLATFPESEYRKAMEQLVVFTTERKS